MDFISIIFNLLFTRRINRKMAFVCDSLAVARTMFNDQSAVDMVNEIMEDLLGESFVFYFRCSLWGTVDMLVQFSHLDTHIRKMFSALNYGLEDPAADHVCEIQDIVDELRSNCV